jgi:integrase
VRQRPSGRWQAIYTGPDGLRRPIGTFDTRGDADAALSGVHADVARGTYRAPERADLPIADYARRWLARQRDLAPRTRELYGRLLEGWVLSDLRAPGGRAPINLGTYPLRSLSPTLVAEWQDALVGATERAGVAAAQRQHDPGAGAHARAWARERGLAVGDSGRLPAAVLEGWRAAGSPSSALVARPAKTGRTAAARAYSLLRTICSSAVRERLIESNPCQVPRAGQAKPAERVPPTLREVEAIAAAYTGDAERYRAAVIVAAWSGLRAGELFALERRHVEVLPGGGVRLRVEQALVELVGQPVTFGPPKSAAGRRTVHLPAAAATAIVEHLARWTAPGATSLVFATSTGRPLRRAPRTQAFTRAKARSGVRAGIRWHDLRHAGATIAAQAGATLAELQHRMGHSTIAAAMVYQHSSDDADAALAARMADRASALASSNVLPLARRA